MTTICYISLLLKHIPPGSRIIDKKISQTLFCKFILMINDPIIFGICYALDI